MKVPHIILELHHIPVPHCLTTTKKFISLCQNSWNIYCVNLLVKKTYTLILTETVSNVALIAVNGSLHHQSRPKHRESLRQHILSLYADADFTQQEVRKKERDREKETKRKKNRIRVQGLDGLSCFPPATHPFIITVEWRNRWACRKIKSGLHYRQLTNILIWFYFDLQKMYLQVFQWINLPKD